MIEANPALIKTYFLFMSLWRVYFPGFGEPGLRHFSLFFSNTFFRVGLLKRMCIILVSSLTSLKPGCKSVNLVILFFSPVADNLGCDTLTQNNEGKIMHKFTCLAFLFLCLFLNVTDLLAEGDLLKEMKLHAIPQEMTFEEYQDANRRLLSGVLVSSLLPVPGMMHFYAGEKKTGYRLLAVTGVGVLSILGGMAGKNGKGREADALGNSLVVLGGGAIIACHLYDWIHGIKTIEEKRDRVRFKYGKQLNFSMDPMIDPDRSFAGVSVGVKF